MAGVIAVAGTKLYIGTSETIASPDDWVEIGNISNLGNIGLQFDAIDIQQVGSGYTYQIKGTQNAPNLALVLNRDDADLGQIALKAASAAARGTLYNFRLIEADTTTTSYWKGEVFGYGSNYGGVNDIRRVETAISVKPDTLVIG